MSYNSIKAAREAARLWSWKDPVVIAIASGSVTPSGEQTLQSVDLVSGDAVLILDGVEAGIRVVQTGAWARREDARAVGSLRQGTMVRVTSGTNAGLWHLATSGEIEPGVTSMTWTSSPTLDGYTVDADTIQSAGNLTVSANGGGDDLVLEGLTIDLQGTVTVNGAPLAGASYTFGDGLTLTAGDVDVDLTDTAVFSSAGVAGRAAVLDGSGGLALGASSGTPAATGLIRLPYDGPHIVVRNAADSADLDVLSTAATNVITIGDASTTLNLVGSSVLANGGAIGGGSITESDLRTAAAALTATLAVNGQTVSDCAGIASASGSGSWVVDGVTCVGITASGDSVLVDASAVGGVRVGQACAEVHVAPVTQVLVTAPTATITANTKLTLASTTEVETNCGIFDLNATGACTLNATTVDIVGTGAMALTGSTLTLTTSSGAAQYTAANSQTVSVGVVGDPTATGPVVRVNGVSGGAYWYSTALLRSIADHVWLYASTYVRNMAGSRYAVFQGTDAVDRLKVQFPADVSLSTDAETTVLAVSVSTSRPLVCRGVLVVRDASMNVYSNGFEFTAKNVGGTASLVGAVTEVEKNDGGGSIASVASSISASGATILIRATRPAGVACTATVTELEFA